MAINIKKVFADSMVRLLNEKSFEQITVKDLCADCGASRQTFYNHFYDKYDLIVWICRKQCEELWASFQRKDSSRHYSPSSVSSFSPSVFCPVMRRISP